LSIWEAGSLRPLADLLGETAFSEPLTK
jgi:hypothetical protein